MKLPARRKPYPDITQFKLQQLITITGHVNSFGERVFMRILVNTHRINTLTEWQTSMHGE